jgi:hypothetical protein
MKLMCKTFVFGLAVAAASAVGCSGGKATGPGTQGNGEHAGEIGLNLTLLGGEQIPSLSYTLQNGTAADTVTGTVALPNVVEGNTPFVVPTFEIVPVAVGTGYSISVTGASADGTVTCSGSDPATLPVSASNPGFAVTSGNETVVNILVTCVSNVKTGSVQGVATVQNCPTVSTLTAINATANITAPGNTSSIFASAVAPNQAGVTYAFSVTKGTGVLSGQTSAAGGTSSSITFTCPTTGEADTIQVVTTDQTGAVCPASMTTATTTVTCGSPACAGIGTSTPASPNTSAGTCPLGQSNSLIDSAGNFCCAAIPCFGVPTTGVAGTEATPDTAAGTCPAPLANNLTDSAGNFCCGPVVLLPCTTAGQTNCVQCTGSANAPLCTPTEAQIVQSDINKKLDVAGPAATGSCYQCLNAKGCLDDNLGDTGAECEDGAFTGGTTVAQCQNTIKCVLGTSCNASALSACYCGAATPSGTCTTDTTSVSDPVPASTNTAVIGGSCDVEVSTGLALSITDGIDILKNLTNAQLAAGRADAIFACGVAGKCTACQ